jgi:hypothetical protein
LIVTLTANPAIDRILSVDRLAFEDRAYINSSRDSAGGRASTPRAWFIPSAAKRWPS